MTTEMTKLDDADPRPCPPVSYQLTPDMKYPVSVSGETTTWNVYVTPGSAVQGSTYTMNTELWAIDSSFLGALQTPVTGTTTITIGQGQPFLLPSTPPPVEMPARSLWTPIANAPSSSLFLGTNTAGDTVGLVAALRDATPWGGTLTWYVGTSSGGPPKYAVDSSGITLTYGTVSTSTTLAWYTMTLPPLSWSVTPATVGNAAAGVALAPLGGTLYLAFTNTTDSNVCCSTSTDGASWTTPATTGGSATDGPALASLGSTLYLVWRKHSASTVQMCTNGGSGWSQATDTPADASSAPALGVYSSGSTSVLCMAYLPTGSAPAHMHVRAWNGSSWSDHCTPGTGAIGAPALVGFNGQLLLAQQGATSRTIEIYQASSVSSSGTRWSSSPVAVIQISPSGYTATCDPSAPAPADGALVLARPSFGVHDGQLYLAFTDEDQRVWICSSSDGVSFSGFAKLSHLLGETRTHASTALAAFTPTGGATTLAAAIARTSDIEVLTAT